MKTNYIFIFCFYLFLSLAYLQTTTAWPPQELSVTSEQVLNQNLLAFISNGDGPINEIRTKENTFKNSYPFGLHKNIIFYGSFLTYGNQLTFVSPLDSTSLYTKPAQGSLVSDDQPPSMTSHSSRRPTSNILILTLNIVDNLSGMHKFECTNLGITFYSYNTLVLGNFQNGEYQLVFHLDSLSGISSSQLVIYLYDLAGNKSPQPLNLNSLKLTETLNQDIPISNLKYYRFTQNSIDITSGSIKNSLYFSHTDLNTQVKPSLTIFKDTPGSTEKTSQTFFAEYHEALDQHVIDFEVPSNFEDDDIEYSLLAYPTTFTSTQLKQHFGSVAKLSAFSTNSDISPPIINNIEYLNGQLFDNIHIPFQMGWKLTIDNPSRFKSGVFEVASDRDPAPFVINVLPESLVNGGVINLEVTMENICVEQQLFKITKATLFDIDGKYSTYPPSQGEINALPIVENHDITVKCTSNQPVATDPRLTSFNYQVTGKSVSVTMVAELPNLVMDQRHAPYIYVTSIHQQIRFQTTPGGDGEFSAIFDLPDEMLAFGCSFSVYGITNKYLSIAGYPSDYLSALRDPYYRGLVMPEITSVSSFYSIIGGQITIYGKAFPKNSKVYIKQQGTQFQVVGQDKIVDVSSSVIIFNVQPTENDISVKVTFDLNQTPMDTNVMVSSSIKFPSNYVFVCPPSNLECTTKYFESIQEAIDSTNGVKFTIALYPGTYNGQGNTDLKIKNSILKIISIEGPESTIIDCEGFGFAFKVENSKKFSLSDVTIRNCRSDRGAAFYSANSRSYISNVHFLNNIASEGGAIYVSGQELTITDCLFKDNKGTSSGAAIYSDLSLVKIKGDMTHFVPQDHTSNPPLSSNVDIIGQPDDILCLNSTIKVDSSISMDGVGFKCLAGCDSFYSKKGLCIYKPPITPPPASQSCGKESCLTLPNQCPCYFSGMVLETYEPAADCTQNNYKSCVVSQKQILQRPTVENFMGGFKNIVARIYGYISVYESKYLTFVFSGSEIGFALKVDGLNVYSLSQTSKFNETKSIYMLSDSTHFVEIILFSSGDALRRKFSMNPILDINDQMFYSNLVCGDKVLNQMELIDANEFYCPPDHSSIKVELVQNKLMIEPTCGDGICNEKEPNSCFKDCYKQYTKTCPTRTMPDGHIAPGFFTQTDTLGDLITNQFLWRLPGSDHLSFGFNVIDATEGASPVFQFDYCGNIAKNIIEDVFRGNTYHIPDQFNAKLMPECTYSAKTDMYNTHKEIQDEMTDSSSRSYQAKLGLEFPKVSVEASVSFSNEKSVQESSKLTTEEKQKIFKTDIYCKATYVEMDLSRMRFHPNFLLDLSSVKDVGDMLTLIQRYGTHFYFSTFLGGKLSQITVTSEKNVEKEGEKSWTESSQDALSVSVTSPSFSVKGSYSKSLDKTNSATTQESNKKSSTTSKILTYGGVPAAFSPAADQVSSPTYSDWAQSIDLLPVPIDPQLFPLRDYINNQWINKYNQNLNQLWNNAEQIFYQMNNFNRDPDSLFSIIFDIDHTKVPYGKEFIEGKPTLKIHYWVKEESFEKSIELPMIHLDNSGSIHRVFYTKTSEFSPKDCPTYTAFNRDISYQTSKDIHVCDYGIDDIVRYPIRLEIDLPIELFASSKKPIISLSFISEGIEYISFKNPAKIIYWANNQAIFFDQNVYIDTQNRYTTIALEHRWAWHISRKYVFNNKKPSAVLECSGSHCTDSISFKFEDLGNQVQTLSFDLNAASHDMIQWHDFKSSDLSSSIFDVIHNSNIGLQTRILWALRFGADDNNADVEDPTPWIKHISSYHIKGNQKAMHAKEFIEVNHDDNSHDRFDTQATYEFKNGLEQPKQLFFYHNYNYPTEGVQPYEIQDIFKVKSYGEVLTNDKNFAFISGNSEKFLYDEGVTEPAPIDPTPNIDQGTTNSGDSIYGDYNPAGLGTQTFPYGKWK